jgi:ABC-type transport system involved in multi-copper enzyme maturation permease subunit
MRRSEPDADEEFAGSNISQAGGGRRRAVSIGELQIDGAKIVERRSSEKKIGFEQIRTIALSTFGSFLRNKVILLFCSLFVCIVLLMMTPLLAYRTATNAANATQMQGFVLNEVSAVISMVSAFGSLLAAWAAADSVAGEMKSGTILAVMARPLRRWEFLAGKYLGVMMLMAIYVLAMLGVTFFLAWVGGQSFHASLWTLVVYPMVRYAMWAAMAMFLVTMLHPILVMGLVVILATLIEVFGSTTNHIPKWVRLPVHFALPLTSVLSEERFLVITRASVRPFPWTYHLTALAYGLDYALVFFMLAVFVFQRRSLSRE